MRLPCLFESTERSRPVHGGHEGLVEYNRRLQESAPIRYEAYALAAPVKSDYTRTFRVVTHAFAPALHLVTR